MGGTDDRLEIVWNASRFMRNLGDRFYDAPRIGGGHACRSVSYELKNRATKLFGRVRTIRSLRTVGSSGSPQMYNFCKMPFWNDSTDSPQRLHRLDLDERNL